MNDDDYYDPDDEGFEVQVPRHSRGGVSNVERSGDGEGERHNGGGGGGGADEGN